MKVTVTFVKDSCDGWEDESGTVDVVSPLFFCNKGIKSCFPELDNKSRVVVEFSNNPEEGFSAAHCHNGSIEYNNQSFTSTWQIRAFLSKHFGYVNDIKTSMPFYFKIIRSE